MAESSSQVNFHARCMASGAGVLHNFSMAKKAQPESKRRGPYAEDPDQLGTVGIKLRQWRLYRKMTVEELAEAAGVSTGTISGIEAGNSGFSKETLPKFADALEITIAMLFGVNPLANPDFWALYEKANPHQRQLIQAHAQGVVGPLKL